MLLARPIARSAAKHGVDRMGWGLVRCRQVRGHGNLVGTLRMARVGMSLMAKSLFTTPKLVQTDKVLVTTFESGSIFQPPDAATQEKEMARAPYGAPR